MPASWRRMPLPQNWHLIRRNVLERDHYACQWPDPVTGICAALASDVDHIDPDGPQADLSNLRALCRMHHKLKSSREGAAAQHARQPRRRRPPEKHPGLL